MDFVNPHALLVYLAAIDDDKENRWRLANGQQLAELLRLQGHLDPARPNEEYAELGRMLMALKDDASVRFLDHAAEQLPHGRRYAGFSAYTLDDVFKFENIEITREGRQAARADRPTVEINIGSLDVVALLGQMEREVDLLPISDEQKVESKSRMHEAAAVLGSVAKDVIVETAAAVLRQQAHHG